MSINFNHVTNDISASAGSVTIGGSPAGGGAWVWLSTVTANNSATVDIETTLDATYDAYVIVGVNLVPATDNVQLLARMKITGAYATTNYKHHTMTMVSGTATYSASAAQTTMIPMLTLCGNAAGESTNFIMHVYNPEGTSLLNMVDFSGSGINFNGELQFAQGIGANTVAGALTGIRFYFDTGNITSGTFRLYGIKNS